MALKMTSVKLGLIEDSEIYLMIESAIRGGLSYVAQRHARANFPRLERRNIVPTCRRHTSSIWTAIRSIPRVSSFRFRLAIFVYFRTNWHDST